MRVSCWIIEAICAYAHGHAYAPEYPHALARAIMHTQTNMQYLLLFHSNNSFANAPQCYVISTVPVFFKGSNVSYTPWAATRLEHSAVTEQRNVTRIRKSGAFALFGSLRGVVHPAVFHAHRSILGYAAGASSDVRLCSLRSSCLAYDSRTSSHQ
jgi:hypothetical protein